MSLCADCKHSVMLDKYSRTSYRVCKKFTSPEYQTSHYSDKWVICLNARPNQCENGKHFEQK